MTLKIVWENIILNQKSRSYYPVENMRVYPNYIYVHTLKIPVSLMRVEV